MPAASPESPTSWALRGWWNEGVRLSRGLSSFPESHGEIDFIAWWRGTCLLFYRQVPIKPVPISPQPIGGWWIKGALGSCGGDLLSGKPSDRISWSFFRVMGFVSPESCSGPPQIMRKSTSNCFVASGLFCLSFRITIRTPSKVTSPPSAALPGSHCVAFAGMHGVSFMVLRATETMSHV